MTRSEKCWLQKKGPDVGFEFHKPLGYASMAWDLRAAPWLPVTELIGHNCQAAMMQEDLVTSRFSFSSLFPRELGHHSLLVH